MDPRNGDKKPSRRRTPGALDDTPHLEQGSVIGRYVVLYRAGIGGMGVVYAAYDPELDRKIAVKLVHPKREGAEARTRLLREAQAMARLSHPNVIAVHDVGTFGKQVFLALEFVEGESLADWVKRRGHTWREALRIFEEAGRGLAAAHAAGLVHRDFKPGNVLLGADGRVRVLDFGMARPRHEPGSDVAPKTETKEPSRPPLPPSRLATPVTEDGMVIGTLPYMAPEVPRNQGVDARSDQFSYCVAFYEALYGEHPFASPGDSTLDLIDRLLRGEVKPAPPGSPVPGWLRNVLLRGLSPDPEARYPSMEALLAALRETPHKRRRLAVVAIAAVGMALGGFGLYRYLQNDRPLTECEAGAARIFSTLSESRREGLRDTFLSLGSPFAADAWRIVQDKLEGYAAVWSQQYIEACEETHLRDHQSIELLDRRLQCLDRRRTELDALLTLFARADEKVVEQAVAAVESLARPEGCGDIEVLLASVPRLEDPEVQGEVQWLREELAQAQALAASGRYADALAGGQAVEEKAEELAKTTGDASLLGDALLLNGEMHRWVGDLNEGASDLVEAMWAAEASRNDRLAAEAARQLVLLLGVDQRLFARAHYWVRLGTAKLDRALGDVRELRADLLDATGTLLRMEGRYDEARERHLEAQALYREIGSEDLRFATSLDALAATLGSMGRHDEARERFARALEIHLRELGPDHPLMAKAHNNLGIELRHLGRLEEALEHLQRADELFRQGYGPEHRYVVSSLNNLANTLNQMGRHDEAETRLSEALSIARRNDDPEQLTLTLVNLADTLTQLGRHAEALPLQRQALELDEAKLGPSHPFIADDLQGVATSLLALGRAAEAVPHLERALEIRISVEGDAVELAATRFALARALEASDSDAERARRLAGQARSIYAEDPERFRDELDEVDGWLLRAAKLPLDDWGSDRRELREVSCHPGKKSSPPGNDPDGLP